MSVDEAQKRVEQLYRCYLNALYATGYFRQVHLNTTRYAQHFDFSIGVGTAVSGGSGLSILADQRLAWLCAALTSTSVILSVAKANYNWAEKVKYTSDLTEKYGRLAGKYEILIDEINSKCKYDEKMDESFSLLRKEELDFSPQIFPDLNLEKQKEIQNRIKSSIDYKNWWRPT
jgi:hypothetical protein